MSRIKDMMAKATDKLAGIKGSIKKFFGKEIIDHKPKSEEFTIRVKRPRAKTTRNRHAFPLIAKIAWYGKAQYRLDLRHHLWQGEPAKPTSSTFRDSRGRQYRVWSDGSYRRMVAVGKRQLIPV